MSNRKLPKKISYQGRLRLAVEQAADWSREDADRYKANGHADAAKRYRKRAEYFRSVLTGEHNG